MEKLEILPPNATNKQKDAVLMKLGWKPRPWQKVEMHRMRSKRVYGLNVARQNGKSYNNNWRAIELAVFYGMSGVISVHNETLRNKLLLELEEDLRTVKAAGLLKSFTKGAAATATFHNGASITIRIRGRGFITGLTLDYLIVDEAQKCHDWILAEARPVLRTSKLGAIYLVGTPQTDEDARDYPENEFTRMLESGGMGASNYSAFPAITDELMEMEKIPWAELQKGNPSWRDIPNYKEDMKAAFSPSQNREHFWIFYGAVPKLRSADQKRKPPRFSLKEVEGFLTRKGSVASKTVASISLTADSPIAYAAFSDGQRVELGHRWEIPYGELYEIASDLKAAARNFTQIRITATPRGKALAKMLESYGMAAKVKLIDSPTTSANLALFTGQLTKGDLKIVDVDPKGEAKSALASFWVEVSERSGGAVPMATSKTDEAVVLALANAALDDKTTGRMVSLQRNAQRPQATEVRRNRSNFSW